MWVGVLLQLVLAAIQYLQQQKLIDAGEAAVVNRMLARAKERQDAAKKVSDAAGKLDDGWLQPDKHIGADGRVLPADKESERN
jgi:hypothetical protein